MITMAGDGKVLELEKYQGCNYHIQFPRKAGLEKCEVL